MATWGCPAGDRLLISAPGQGPGSAAAAMVLADRLWLLHHNVTPDALRSLLHQAVAFARTRAGGLPDATLETVIYNHDDLAASVLAECGFAPERPFADVLVLHAPGPAAAPSRPPTTLSEASTASADEWLSAHAAAFPALPLDPIRLAALRRRPTHRVALDVLLRAQAGDIASFATVWLDERSGDAWIEPLGTTPRHRGAGFAGALLSAVCERCWLYGAKRILLALEPENAAAQRLYTRGGFARVAQQSLWQGWI